MMITMERKKELRMKSDFVEGLRQAFEKVETKHSIKSIYYRVFGVDNVVHEYVVVEFKGGALSVANCSGNSMTAIFTTLAKMVNGCYYD